MISMEFYEQDYTDYVNRQVDKNMQVLVNFINYQSKRITELEKRIEKLEKGD